MGRATREREGGRDGDGQGLGIDQTVRQRLFQFGHTSVSDLGAFEVKLLQIRQALEILQTRAGDLSVAKFENL